jgi:hypothetical protein
MAHVWGYSAKAPVRLRGDYQEAEIALSGR